MTTMTKVLIAILTVMLLGMSQVEAEGLCSGTKEEIYRNRDGYARLSDPLAVRTIAFHGPFSPGFGSGGSTIRELFEKAGGSDPNGFEILRVVRFLYSSSGENGASADFWFEYVHKSALRPR
ncbi:MAG: hypothetical protein HY220_01565 [Candidatus Sungbacteria bacterium]|uniref:Uncharacterized protein n=1 Tax=Candidatus Sungiibacteriota bacterium TaxID=2750080 RepID=A0A9D6LQX9_9BACT|nr:hypothetical protein [Candidatus Sungbacteria bacterium]